MFRTVLQLDINHPVIRDAQRTAHAMHQLVMVGFQHAAADTDFFADPQEPHPTARADQNILYALDRRPNGALWLMVQADVAGDWTGVDGVDRVIHTGEFSPPSGGNIIYRIRASAEKTIHENNKRPLTVEEIPEWWERTSRRAGLELISPPAINRNQPIQRKGKTPKNQLFSYTITGTAHVEDNEKFHTAIRVGLGRAKAYGSGLLLTRKLK